MAEEKTKAGGVEITTGEKDVGQKMLEAVPALGNAIKTYDAGSKLSDGVTGSEISNLASEGSGFVQSLGTAALGIATDPIGWMVGEGLNFLISVVQPLEDAIHFVSGDGPALSQAAENFDAIGQGVTKLREKFGEDLRASLQNWGGDAAEAAGTKLGEFAKGIDGVAGHAGEVSQLLQISSMIMTIVEDFVKALLTELITWLIMIWIPALAAAVPTAGASTAAAGTATAGRAAATGGRVSRMIAKLRQLLDNIMAFLRNLCTRLGNLRTGFQRSMANKQLGSHFADMSRSLGDKSPMTTLWSADGMLGSRLQDGFGKSIKTALRDTAVSEIGLGKRENAGIDKPLRNISGGQKAAEYDDTGADQSKRETEGHLDI